MLNKNFSRDEVEDHHDCRGNDLGEGIPEAEKLHHGPHDSIVDQETNDAQRNEQRHGCQPTFARSRNKNPNDRNDVVENDGYREADRRGDQVVEAKELCACDQEPVVNDEGESASDEKAQNLGLQTAGGGHFSTNSKECQQKIAVLIPCWNEALTIGKVVADFRRVMPQSVVYVYDNNSTDGTAEIAKQAGAVVRHEHRQGKGNVMRTMFREIDADCYVLVDGDDTYPAEAAPAMVRRVLRDHVDMVLGDRLSSTYFTENKRPFHNSGNVLVRRLINMLFLRGRKPVLDIMTGYRAFSPLFVKSFPVLSRGFEVETEMTIHALDKNLGIESMPITYRDRPEGSFSKLSTFRDGIKVLWTIFLLFKDYRPMLFFSMLSGLLLLIGLGFLWPVLEEYMRTGLVPRLPTFIAACFLALFSLLSFVCGLILDTITKKDRQNFEIDLNMLYQLGLRETGK